MLNDDVKIRTAPQNRVANNTVARALGVEARHAADDVKLLSYAQDWWVQFWGEAWEMVHEAQDSQRHPSGGSPRLDGAWTTNMQRFYAGELAAVGGMHVEELVALAKMMNVLPRPHMFWFVICELLLRAQEEIEGQRRGKT